MPPRINQNRDEDQTGAKKAMELANLRATIRVMLENGGGRSVNQMANEIASRYHMCGATVKKFTYGETQNPSTWTLHYMGQEAGMRLVYVPADAKLPEGSMPVA